MPADKHPKRKLKRWFFVFLIWLLAFILLFEVIGVEEAVSVIASLNPAWLAAAVGLFMASVMLSVLNWAFLARVSGVTQSLRFMTQAMLVGMFVDDILPNIAPGGEVTMAYLLHKKSRAPFSKSLASVIMHMIAWFTSFVIVASVVVALMLSLGQISLAESMVLAMMLLVFAFLLVMIFYLAVKPRVCSRTLKGVIWRIVCIYSFITRKRFKRNSVEKRAVSTIESFSETFSIYTKHKRVILLSFITMIAYQLLLISSFYAVVMAFNVQMSFLVAALIFLSVNLISLLSLVPGQLGVFEFLSLTLLSLTAGLVNGALITGVVRLISYWTVVFTGGFLAVKMGLQSLKRDLK